VLLIRFHRRLTRQRRNRVVACLCAGWYLLLVSGIPLPVGGSLANQKDHTTPFPCMNSPCGCQNADECWRNCCCHTPSERLAWAKQHGVTPPAFVVAMAKRSTPVASCCAKTKSCCESPSHSARDGQQHETTAQSQRAPAGGLVLRDVLKCRGAGMNWLGVDVCVPPLQFACATPQPVVSQVDFDFSCPLLLAEPPPVRPPRF
jgi:hypothetical protein